jgi:hypothetical protein
MPEIKQNFTRGKMNKDLDERLIPKGEYREAQNIHISESEGSDVGAIENVLSNEKLTSAFSGLGTNVSGEGYEVIGYCKDLAKKRVVYFISNFSNTSFTDDIRNIDRALKAGTPGYAPFGHDSAIVLYDIENNTQNILVKGPWLNLSKNHLITGAAIVEDLLFWTDNLNQPRKINIQTALEEGPDYYDCEENISVAKYAPYKAIMLHDDSASAGSLPKVESGIESEYLKERFVRFSYRYKYDDGEYSLIAPFTQAVFEPLNEGQITNSIDDDERNSTSNEPEVLTGKKEVYKKGIVDIMQNRINTFDLRIPLPNKDEFLGAIGGHSAGYYSNPYHIKEIEILLKESDGISFKLVKSVKVDEIDSSNIVTYTHQSRSNTTLCTRHAFKFTYKSSEPFQVLPESQVNRVYDQVPLIAKTLEVVGNRVVFGNYVENYSYPTDVNNKKGINYIVNETVKGEIDKASLDTSEPYLFGLKQWMSDTYKFHTVKQRRTYQIGVVFSDAFGRQSPVILSSNTELSNPDTITVLPETQNYGENNNAVWNTTHDSYGKSLTINFQDNYLTNDEKFVANLVYGDNAGKRRLYNPHGWYSYRIVVKQQEQEYYNVYAPHTFDGWDNVRELPNDSLTGGRSWLFLHGDNVNKVPRSLNDTDLNRDGTMGSNVRLYPKVIFDSRDGLRLGNRTLGIVTSNSSGIADDDYTIDIVSDDVTTTGNGNNAQITLTVTSGAVSNVDVVNSGSGFKVGDIIIIASTPFTAINNVTLTLRQEDLYDSPGESRQNNSYHELTEVISLGTAYEQNLYMSGDDNKSGTGGFTVYKFIYGKDKNPLVAEVQNMKAYTGNTSNNKAEVYFARTDKTKQTTFNLDSDQLGTPAAIADDQLNGYSINFTSLALHTDVLVEDTFASQQEINLSSPQTVKDADKLVFSKYYEGLSVFETEPFVSKLDIYYETSTCGLVKDLTEELIVLPESLPTGLTIKQDTYDFGTDQDPLGTGDTGYGSLAYLYENTTANTYIADLDATEAAANTGVKNLTFSIQKATRVGDGANITNDLTIVEVSGVYKVRVVGTFVYRGNDYDDINLLVAVTDNTSGETAYLSAQLEVRNSKPTIDSLPSNIDIQKDAGKDSNVITSNNNFTNGGLVTGGSFNKYSDVEVTHSFPPTGILDANGEEIDFAKYFKVNKLSIDGKYEVKTTDEWDVPNATSFFAANGIARTMTITVTDSGGLTNTASTIIDEDSIVVKKGLIREYNLSQVSRENVQSVLSTTTAYNIWATTGTSANDPRSKLVNNQPVILKAYPGNNMYTIQDLSKTLGEGKYILHSDFVLERDNVTNVTKVVNYFDVIEVNSSGKVTSILATYTF